MNNIFSLSFSNLNFQVLHLTNNENKINLISHQTHQYPFKYNFDNLFASENIEAIAGIINDQKENAGIDNLTLMISLPINFSLQKKIALPVNAEEVVINEQVEWELSHYLPGELSDFKVIMTDSSFDYNDYKETLFICIHKKIINSLKMLADHCNSSLSKLVVDNFALENFIITNKIIDLSKNQILFNIDKIQHLSHFYIGGKYFTSYSENINPLKLNSYNEKIVRISKEKYLVIKNLNEQLPFGQNREIEIFIYGQGLSDTLTDALKKSFSGPVHKIEASAYPNMEPADIYKYVEVLGVYS